MFNLCQGLVKQTPLDFIYFTLVVYTYNIICLIINLLHIFNLWLLYTKVSIISEN